MSACSGTVGGASRCSSVASAPPAGAGPPGQVGEGAAGLGDDRHQRGHVPQRQLRLDHHVQRPLGEQHVAVEVAVRPAAPAVPHQVEHRVQPAGLPPSRSATSSRSWRRRAARTPETRIGVAGRGCRPGVRARARAAHQRRPSAGAETRPTTGRSPSISAIRVAQIGTPRTKFLVPSIGSITHRRPSGPAGGCCAVLLAEQPVAGPVRGQQWPGSPAPRRCRRRRPGSGRAWPRRAGRARGTGPWRWRRRRSASTVGEGEVVGVPRPCRQPVARRPSGVHWSGPRRLIGRRRRPRWSLVARREVDRSPAREASNRRYEASRRGSALPAATQASSAHSASSGGVRAVRRAVDRALHQVGEAVQQALGRDVGQPEAADPRGVDDPARVAVGRRVPAAAAAPPRWSRCAGPGRSR